MHRCQPSSKILAVVAILALGAATPSRAEIVNYLTPDGSQPSGVRAQPVTPTTPLPTSTQGAVAGGSTDSGAPVKAGAVYNSPLPTYTTGQRTDLQADSRGNLNVDVCQSMGASCAGVSGPTADGLSPSGTAQVGLAVRAFTYGYNGSGMDRVGGNATGLGVVLGGIPATHWSYAAASGGIVNSTTAVTLKTAAGSGIRNCVSSVQIAHDALGGATEVAIRDGAAGTVIWRGKLQVTASEGAQQQFAAAICGTANTLMEVVTLTAVTGGVFVDAQGYTSP